MLVAENGEWMGGISGGCLEGDALKRAKMAILKSQASIIRYDTTTDDDHQIGVGLGCNGIIDVLFKPIDFKDGQNPVEVLKSIEQDFESSKEFVTITKTDDTSLLGLTFPAAKAEHYLMHDQLTAFSDLLGSQKVVFDDHFEVFFEVIQPPVHVVLFGHQYDIYPLIRLCNELGWRVTIVAPPVKVKKSTAVKVVAPEEAHSIKWTSYTLAVLMSHSLLTDKENLQWLAKTTVPYIGMLGPKERSTRMCEELNIDINDTRIFAPVGLDIGAETPDEIALSIVAEIKSFLSGRKLDYLKNRKTTIHDRKPPKQFR